MVQDYPDCYDHVERTPIQKTSYQIYGIYSSEDIIASPSSSSTNVWNMPNDGYYYAIDTVFYIVNHIQPFKAFVDLADNQFSPSWYTMQEGAQKQADNYEPIAEAIRSVNLPDRTADPNACFNGY